MQLNKKQMLDLFNASIENAFSLYQGASEVILHSKNKRFPSLGLAELALEELGKSYSCLSMYSKGESIQDWSPFWREWRNHILKAHRAFFYEFFSVARIEVEFHGKELKFPAIRQDFSKEKEAAFYVDIDKGNGKIYRPEIEISDEECVRRITSLMGLFNASFYVKDWMNTGSSEDFKNAISDYAHLTINTEMYQQNVLKVLQGMKTDNKEYNNGLAKISELFSNSIED